MSALAPIGPPRSLTPNVSPAGIRQLKGDTPSMQSPYTGCGPVGSNVVAVIPDSNGGLNRMRSLQAMFGHRFMKTPMPPRTLRLDLNRSGVHAKLRRGAK